MNQSDKFGLILIKSHQNTNGIIMKYTQTMSNLNVTHDLGDDQIQVFLNVHDNNCYETIENTNFNDRKVHIIHEEEG